MLIAAALALLATAERPLIKINSTADGYRAEVADFDLLHEVYVNGEIERRAAALCADKQIDWGKFGSETKIDDDPGKAPAKVSGFFKEFRCVISKEPVVASVSSDWKASEADEADVRRTFDLYYAKRDAGDLEGSSAMLRPISGRAVRITPEFANSTKCSGRAAGKSRE